MEVFIGNLAANVTQADLINFFKGYANKARIRIVEKRQQDGSKMRFAIAAFNSDKLALRAIRKLSRKPLLGERVVLHEYFYRCYANENRAVNWRDQPWKGVERRRQERRKQQDLPPDDYFDLLGESHAEPERIQISAYANLARKA